MPQLDECLCGSVNNVLIIIWKDKKSAMKVIWFLSLHITILTTHRWVEGVENKIADNRFVTHIAYYWYHLKEEFEEQI